jgi:hypothetical protein
MTGQLALNEILGESRKRVNRVLVAGELASHKVEIPITIASGKEPRPTLVVTAGMHATEYAAIMTAYKLAQEVDPNDIQGSLIIAPLVNRYGFEAFSRRENPVDHVNLNRIFPGNPNGSLSYQMAYVLFKEVISKADCYIDLHGGEIGESLAPFIVNYKTNDKVVDEKAESLIGAFGFEYVWQPANALDTTNSAEQSESGFAITQATKVGIPSFIAEAGEEGRLEQKHVQLLYEGVLNVMRAMGMTKGKPKATNLRFCREASYLLAGKSGMLQLAVKAGELVKSGQKLAEILSFEGNVLESVRAPFDAIVVSERTFAVVKSTDLLFLILRL